MVRLTARAHFMLSTAALPRLIIIIVYFFFVSPYQNVAATTSKGVGSMHNVFSVRLL